MDCSDHSCRYAERAQQLASQVRDRRLAIGSRYADQGHRLRWRVEKSLRDVCCSDGEVV